MNIAPTLCNQERQERYKFISVSVYEFQYERMKTIFGEPGQK